jgi:hypothetical protein
MPPGGSGVILREKKQSLLSIALVSVLLCLVVTAFPLLALYMTTFFCK